MTRRSIVLIAAVGVLVMSLSGVAFGAKPLPVKRWTAGVCGELAVWKVEVVKAGQTGDPKDAAAGKAAITKYFSRALKATDELAEQLDALGAPKTENGAAIASALTDGVAALRSAYADAKSAAGGLPTGDSATFSAAAAEIGEQVAAAGDELGAALAAASASTSKQLDRAFAKTKACHAIT